ncbi:HAMP domain-containing sensor histidine kinase [Ruminococcus sp.]|uniref:sensor histidine kinase n=1 Tax=Ruminococcus sp. TaxID=41978 RepID=UPI0025D3856F|nr:HAMP domain-containing sensor histidine kinase [Ruminococcus sp.]MBQ8965840.1 HAMP domain-containing histidine kinase [Ruminococcus sp.]
MVLVITSLLAAVLAVIVILQRREMSSVKRQLSDIRSKDTNNLVRSSNGLADDLINEVNILLKEMRRDRAENSRKNHAMEQMMTNISHDLRTPLTSALGYIDILRSSDAPEEEKQRELEIIRQRLGRLEELIDSFFEFSKVISGSKLPDMEELDLVGVLEESIVHYYDDYEGRGRSIELDCPRNRIMTVSNRSMLLRIFDNLIGNALKHGTGTLKVAVEQGSALSISFENSADLGELDIDHIFDEFYTTDISRTRGNTGLGLAIAKQFTEMLGGSITASAQGDIFTVTVSFPMK